MIEINFTEAEKEKLAQARYKQTHPHVSRKLEVIWCKSLNLPHQQIAEIADVSPNTVTRYLKEYHSGGLSAIMSTQFYQPKSKLVDQSEAIKAYFEKHPPANLAEASAKIEELTGLKRSPTQVGKFLKGLGMRCLKVGTIPAKADVEEQARFKKEELQPRIEEAQAGQRALFFVDAAHFVLAPFLGLLWCFSRIFIKAPAGRQRFNVLGALNAINHDLVSITNDNYINADSVCQLLTKLRLAYPDIPITLVLDNARYQRCKKVWTMAALMEIELLYLPPYSPNLNLIERLWKFVKKKALYSKYYPDFRSFKAAISHVLDNTHSLHKQELDSLLSLNFQTFQFSPSMTL